jgi:hypothetical protein
MMELLGLLRGLVGLAQSALLLGGCASLIGFIDPRALGAFIVWFLILCLVQLAILGLAALFAPKP